LCRFKSERFFDNHYITPPILSGKIDLLPFPWPGRLR